MTRCIPLTQEQVALVDDEDYERVSEFKWYAEKRRGGRLYACRKMKIDVPSRWRQERVPMQNFIIGAAVGCIVDHVNGNGLDNRRENLRAATVQENTVNRRYISPISSCVYRGVVWNKKSQKWQAGAKKDGRSIHLGLFDTPHDAAQVYDEFIRREFGLFGRFNFPRIGEQPALLDVKGVSAA